ncbi:hypothetical protein D9M68_691810 [compost metagenome]
MGFAVPINAVFLASIHQALLAYKPFRPGIPLIAFPVFPGISLLRLDELYVGVCHGIMVSNLMGYHCPEVDLDSFHSVKYVLP